MRSHVLAVVRQAAVALLAAAIALVCPDSGRGATLSTDGKPNVTIVLIKDPIPAEQTAARELADYLEKVTGGAFSVVAEPDAPNPGPSIYVGPTSFLEFWGHITNLQ